jgi:hypothetical protein
MVDPLLSLDTPFVVDLTFLGRLTDGTPLLTNPSIPGEYHFTADFYASSSNPPAHVESVVEIVCSIGCPVGGIVALPVSGSGTGSALPVALAGGAALAMMIGVWFGRRRWSR